MDTTSALYHPAIDDISMPSILHALGDPVRLQIARTLYTANKPLTCQDGVRNIAGLAVSTRSHCYNLLREGGIIRADKQGRECYNTIRREEIEHKYPGLLDILLG